MSNFVSGGSLEEPVQRDDEWLKAEQELEESRRRKAEQEKQHSGKTLFEVLQENKAKKQDAFEEANKLKNQFRSLDDDEIDFLDSVNKATRAKEALIRKETAEGLSAFRKHQEAAEKAALTGPATEDRSEGSQAWAVKGKKRKKGKEELVKGVKLRKTSSSLGLQQERAGNTNTVAEDLQNVQQLSTTSGPEAGANLSELSISPVDSSKPVVKAPNNALGLEGYSSDEDD